ncbi:serine/threonine-protein kinase PknH/PknJ [Mycobacterium hubeiense]|uniref:serine/threonine-protein kinase PknH/PknJ n=1 Tax=Mycobacterium hubeiense TaxID=1867256 RepID=UPI000C7EE93E|nr:serine/threonine-protein kinase PknH/PknJ [Mycobacterium sp. QGD 101]
MHPVGAVIAGYRVERVLGSGGMGTVYLTQNPELPRRDALKVLSAGLSRNPEFRARFIREADVASRLNHPNIVSVYSRGETDGQLWIAMQFVDGTDADAALRAGTMTPARAVHIVAEVAKGLDYAHRHNVVHRDIKPGNFLLSGPVGDTERVLLADFGIARALDDVGLTATGALIATMAYAAPEVLAGTGIDGRSDVYSLGCSLFRLLTGKTPFAGANGPAAVMMAHLHQPPPRVTERVPGLPPELDGVIATAMAKDPAQRFQTAGDLAGAARAALDDRATETTVPWTVLPSREVMSYPNPPAGQQWWQSPSGPSTMMSPAAQPTQFRAAAPPSVQPRPATSRRRRPRAWILVAVAAAVLLAGGTVAALSMNRGSSDDTAQPETTTSVSSTPPPVPVSALPELLPPLAELAPIVGGTNLVVDASSPLATFTSGNPTPQECVGVWMPAQNAVYEGSGYRAMQVQSITDHDDARKLTQLTLSVAAFLTAEQAKQFMDGQSQDWAQCANRAITFSYSAAPPVRMDFGPLVTSDDGILLVSQRMDVSPPDQHCNHALAVRNNVVIDVQACTILPGDHAVTIVRDIVARIDQQEK